MKIFANLSDYERAEKSNYIKNDFYAEIERIANEDVYKRQEFQGEGTGSAAHVYNECGEEVLTYTEGVGWQEKETKAESQVQMCIRDRGGFTSLPLEACNMGLNDRRDFISMFKKSIEDLNKINKCVSCVTGMM